MNILILGGGAGGAVLASRLAKKLGEKVNITVVDKNPYHEFRPSYLWISMGIREPDHARRPLKLLEKKKIRFLNEEVLSIDLANRQVKTTNHVLNYDYLAISLGAELVPEKIKGLDKIYHPWEMDTSLKLREEIARFKGGKVVVGPTRLPHRCPPAPLEIAFMIRYLTEQRKISDKTEIKVIHPEWTKPMESFGPFFAEMFSRLMEQYKIEFIGRWIVDHVDTENKIIISDKGEKLNYDLAILVPPHEPSKPIKNNPDLLDSGSGYMKVDKKTLNHPTYKEVYGLGDIIAPTIGLGMAGVFAHFQADYISTRIADEINGVYMQLDWNKTGVCVMDLGFIGAGAFCDFTEMLEGRARYPDCYMLGGMGILRIVKMAFEKYWFKDIFG